MPREIRNALVASALTLMVSSTAEAQGGKPRQYADGVYTATGTYGGQPSHITLKVTLTDGVITAVEVTPHAYVPESLELQRRFAAAVPKVVIGRPIDQVNVGKLAGSSGTSRGFNNAIGQIKRQAARR
ncbi:hypothetical protein [Rhizobium sp. BK538]|uniref:FMN-binding protein n=1 Tax=Rhizobium sp. BK538 TaxID=2586984 RepID=UPI00161B1AB1|nr:hypothetical protein [Rhizobium sp. BK538]MBB4169760.1 uncharacterized protein with FMN-binding domain [Rhizobium sp. BK538]